MRSSNGVTWKEILLGETKGMPSTLGACWQYIRVAVFLGIWTIRNALVFGNGVGWSSRDAAIIQHTCASLTDMGSTRYAKGDVVGFYLAKIGSILQ